MEGATKGAAVKRAVVILTALTAALALAACGSSSSSSSSSSTSAGGASAGGGGGGGGGSQTLKLSADPSGQFKFDTSSLSAKSGKATFDFSNSSPLAHNLTIQDKSGRSLGSTPTFMGGSKSFTLTLQPGTYKFLCTVPGHAAGGMEGTLTVK
jgi:plastocyanin